MLICQHRRRKVSKSVWAGKGARRRRRLGFDAKGVEIEMPKASRGWGVGRGVALHSGGGVWGGGSAESCFFHEVTCYFFHEVTCNCNKLLLKSNLPNIAGGNIY